MIIALSVFDRVAQRASDLSFESSYRFRLVSISCDTNFVFSIDQHNLTIIEADGNNVLPLLVDSIQVLAGTSSFTPFS